MMDEIVLSLDLKVPDDALSKLLRELNVDLTDVVSLAGCSTDFQGLTQAFILIIGYCLEGKFEIVDATAFFKHLEQNLKGFSSMLADVLAVVDIETMCVEQSSNEGKTSEDDGSSKRGRAAFLKFLTEVEKEISSVSELLAERLELDTLESLGQIKSTDLFNKKYVKSRTKLFYKQNKFNLLREENEGYSKLLTELNQDSISGSPEQFVCNLKSLIGKFNLDPNRVVDLILEVLECNSGTMKQYLIQVLHAFGMGSSVIAQFLGFKFQHFKSTLNVTRTTPESLLHVTADLISSNVIKLQEIYVHLIPSDKEMNETYKKYLINCRQAARKMTAAILNEKTAEENAKEMEILRRPPDYGDNQKLGVIEQLIVMGDWKNANELINELPVPASYVLDYSDINFNFCRLIHHLIEPLYKKTIKESSSGLPPASIPSPQESPLCLSSKNAPKQAQQCVDLSGTVCDMLLTLGPALHTDPYLFVKLCRIATVALKGYAEKAEKTVDEVKVYRTWLQIFDGSMLPALSLMSTSCYYSELLWTAFQYLPYQDRYHLYYLWKSQAYSNDPVLILKKAEVADRIKYLMKRLTKDTVKSIGRHIAKLAFSNPLIAFDHVITQLQKYDNLNVPMADVLKMFSQLSVDVMIYTLVEELSDPSKQKINQATASLSPWLNSLAVFTGLICKKYVFDTSGLLQYIANQLKAERNFDLVILKELLSKMTGVAVFEDITNDELFALGGAELLKSEAAYQGQVRACQKSSKRLKDTMVDINIAFPICMLLANHRNSIVFKEGVEGHLKLIGSLYDQSQDCLVQMLEFLDLNLSLDEMASLPSFDQLLSNYGLSPDAAFSLSRIKFQRQINLKFEEMKQEERSKCEDGKLQDRILDVRIVVKKYKEAVDAVMEGIMASTVPVLQSESTTALLFDHVTHQFYFTFWSLSLYDIRVPVDVYDKEVTKLNTQKQAIEARNDWSDGKKTKEKEKINLMVEKLKEEQQKQLDHVTRVMYRLKSESKHWFPNKTAKSECIVRMQQFCLYQRCLFSASDAVFCALFIKIIHSLQAVNFSTILCFDRVFSDLIYNVASFTENEASRYGRFLYSMWEIILKWHSDKAVYDKECSNYPGFFMTIRKDANSSAGRSETILEYENFRHVCYKWQFKVARDLIQCLESQDYIQTRNTVILLTRMLPYFPKVTHLAAAIEKRVDKVRQEEKDNRPDLSSLCMGYVVKMKTQKAKLIPEEQFHDKTDRAKKQEKMKQNEAAAKKGATNTANATIPKRPAPTDTPATGGSKAGGGATAKTAAAANDTAKKTVGGDKSPVAAADSKKRKIEKSDKQSAANASSTSPAHVTSASNSKSSTPTRNGEDVNSRSRSRDRVSQDHPASQVVSESSKKRKDLSRDSSDLSEESAKKSKRRTIKLDG